MEFILAALHKHDPEMPVVLSLVFPSSASKKRPADAIKKINQLYREAVKTNQQVTVVDTWTLFANKDGDAKKEQFPKISPSSSSFARRPTPTAACSSASRSCSAATTRSPGLTNS